MCMTIVKYQVLVNGDGIGLQDPSRGLQQVDMLYSYLFIICVEGLSAVQKDQKPVGISTVSKCVEGAQLLTQLLFVDDCFLLCRANEKEAKTNMMRHQGRQ